MNAAGAGEPSSTFSAGSGGHGVDLRLPAGRKNRLRTACRPGAAPAALRSPGAGFVRGIAGCRRGGPLPPRACARARTRRATCRGGARGGRGLRCTNRMRGGAWWRRGLVGAEPGGGAASAAQVVAGPGGCDFAPNSRGLLACGLPRRRSRRRHGSAAELHRRRVPEYGHRQERRPALASAQVPAGLGSPALLSVGHLAETRRPT